MLLMQVLIWIILAAEVWIAGPILYLCILSITAIVVTKKRKARSTILSSSSEASQYNFAVIVPAHNEEILLGSLLKSLAALAYAKDLYTVYVVADNCTDTTAELARTYDGVRVYERFNAVKRGKGYALSWILEKLEEDQLVHDAYVIFDADSVVEPGFLQWMAKGLAHAQALQAHYTVLNATESPSTAIRWIALTLNCYVRPLSRSSLGGSSTLTGNGMCFSRALLKRCPWRAYALSEDYQYYLTLLEQGERVHYVPEAVVRSHMPTTFAQMRTQDIRWESSIPGMTPRRVSLRLLRAGLRLRSLACFEAVAELLVPPFSLLVGWCLLTLLASLLVWSPPALLLSLVLIGGLILYVGTGFYLVRPPGMVYKAFLYAPGFMLWKLWVILVLKRSKTHTSEWVRTSRSTTTKMTPPDLT
jgi:cellulose synthase/poly-beta-1,6-N-acetylglucosamine synthase-like glycosyltransferase